jgi:prevent-host-death family protein
MASAVGADRFWLIDLSCHKSELYERRAVCHWQTALFVFGGFCVEDSNPNRKHIAHPAWRDPTPGDIEAGSEAEENVYNQVMAKDVIHISEAEAVSDFASLMARVRSGAEVIIVDNARPVAVVRPAEPYVRLLSESLRLAREHSSTATLDEDFAKDVEAAIESHREPLAPPAWD